MVVAEEATAAAVVRVMMEEIITNNSKKAHALEKEGMMCSCGEGFCGFENFRFLLVCGKKKKEK